MGLIGWIKKTYYDNRLNKADKLVMESRLAEAEEIYRSLFGKQSMAVVHLANMFATHSNSVDEKIAALQSILNLNDCTDSDNKTLYDNELNCHIKSIEDLSIKEFKANRYAEAVRLIDSIIPYRGNDKNFMNQVHRSHAFLSFSHALKTSSYASHFETIIKELKSYAENCAADIKYFVDTLINKSFYSRAIKLLLPFLSANKNYKKQVIDYLVEIVQGKDKDVPKAKKISDFCQDKKLCAEAASHLYNLSNTASNNKNYSQAVLFDSFASEFLSSDNNFNVSRCYHKFKELEPRADASEIKSLLELAKKLKLTEQQIGTLKDDIALLAKKCDPIKGINICRLFLSEKNFDLIYIEQAEKLSKSNSSAINAQELLSIITANTDKDSFVDVLSPFVKNISSYGETFVTSAIDKIIRHKSMPMFEKYWRVKEDIKFFNSLVSHESNLSQETVHFVASKKDVFLHSNKLLYAFTKAIDSLKDARFSLQSAEELFKNGSDVLSYFLEKTNNLCDGLSDDDSVSVIDHTLNVIDYSHIQQSLWIPLYIRKRKIQEKGITALSQRTSFYKESIDTILNSSTDFSEISEPSYFNLWQDYTAIILKRSESQPKEKAIADLTETREQIENHCKSYLTYTTLCETLTNRIAKLRWEVAKELEEYGDFDKAMEQYKATVREGSSSFKTKADFRYLICAVKANKLTEDIEDDIKLALERKSYQSLKDDLAYRYACLLIKSTRPSDADYIIKTFLPTENQLLEICQNLYIKESEKYLEDFNSKFAAVAKESLPLQDAISFLNQFSNYKYVISRNLHDTTNKFIGYRRKLEAYIVKSFFDDEKYSEAFSMLLKIFPYFYEDDTNFRNVAIASLGIIESEDHNVSEDVIKQAISIWLSATYSDRLFVKSLDYTSWDDQFTFTLEGSLGNSSYDDYDELPDNINFDTPIDNQNIAILDSQNSLISRAESIIRDKLPNMESFFNQEKEALDTLISLNLDESCIIAAPYFANKFQRILESIKDAMDTELTRGYGNDEDVISLGVKYGFGGGDYERYKKAYDCAQACKDAYGKPASLLKAALSTLPKIQEFDKLYSSLKSFFSNKMNEAIKEEMHYSEFVDTFEVVCAAFNDTALSLGFSQYANGEVVHLLNEDTMHERDGAMLLARIYNIAPSNIQVKQNLEGVLKALARITVEKNQRADVAALNRALEKVGEPFKKAVNITLIVQKVNNDKMSHKTALTELYKIYVQDRNDEEVCENLVALCDICIWRYIIGDTYDSYSIASMLDKIYNNRSTAFKNSSSDFAASFFKILKELSEDNRRSILMGLNLNSKGQALREGLKYFAKFAPDGAIPDSLARILRI